jgi:hypothetical protein
VSVVIVETLSSRWEDCSCDCWGGGFTTTIAEHGGNCWLFAAVLLLLLLVVTESSSGGIAVITLRTSQFDTVFGTIFL